MSYRPTIPKVHYFEDLLFWLGLAFRITIAYVRNSGPESNVVTDRKATYLALTTARVKKEETYSSDSRVTIRQHYTPMCDTIQSVSKDLDDQ